MDARTGARLPPGWTPLDPFPDPDDAAPATVVALRVTTPDGAPAWLHTVVGDIGGAARRRLRNEQPALQHLLTTAGADPAGAVLLPWFVYGDPKAEHPYVACARPGPTFAEDLLRGPLSVDRVIAVALRCIDALDLLHRQGRTHGLIAPQSLHEEPAAGPTGVRLGSPLPPALAELVALAGGTGHEPPEVLRGREPDPAADVFALASTCWTLLSGRPPFGAPGDQLARLTAAEPPPLLRADVPAAMEAALRAGLSPDPARRPDLRTLAQALHIVEDGAAPVSDIAPDAARLPSDDRQDTLAPTRPVTDAGRPLGSRYLLDALIGRGATGHVWRGHIRDEGTPVAVKLLRSELAEDPEVVTRFMRERAALMRLTHPNLVGIHDMVAEGGALAIVMELVEGRDLRTVLGSGPLPVQAAATLLSQTAAALAAVHEGGFVHRDLKPENVIVENTPAGPRARLTDFGLARTVESATITRQTQLVGTPAYVSPEVVGGREPGPAVDIYAFGVTGYELLAGRRPFAGSSTAAILRAHLDEVPQRPDGVPAELWGLLESCLRKNPAERPAAIALAEAWGRVAAGESPGRLSAATPAFAPDRANLPDDDRGVLDTPLHGGAPPAGEPDAGPVPDELWSSTGVQPTSTSERPLGARHSTPAPARASRAKLWWTIAAVIVLGFGGGFAFFALGKDDAKPAGDYDPYPLAVTVTVAGKIPVIRWTLPPGVASDQTTVVITKFRSGIASPLTPYGLVPTNLRYDASTLQPGDCVVAYANKPKKAPPKDAAAVRRCVPKAAPTKPGSKTP